MRENVAFVALNANSKDSSGSFQVELREGSFDGSVLGVSETILIDEESNRKRIMIFQTPVGVVPGQTYAFNLLHQFAPGNSVTITEFTPGGYMQGEARTFGVVSGKDLWFEEGPAATLIATGTQAAPAQTAGTVRITTRTNTSDSATQQVWQTTVSGSLRGAAIVRGSEQEDSIGGVLVDPETLTARTPIHYEFFDNGVAGQQNQRCALSLRDEVSFLNTTGAPVNITARVNFDGVCTVPVGGSGSILLTCSDGTTNASQSVVLSAGSPQNLDFGANLTLSLAPGASTRQLTWVCNFTASEGTICDARDTLALSYTLPAGVEITGSLMGVPEPGSALLAAFGAGLLTLRRRR